MKTMVAQSFFLLVASLAVTLHAAVLRVPQQYSTIQSAINASSSNDTILISSGKYYENINFRGKSITVKGNGPPDSVEIDGSKPASADSASVVIFAESESSSSILDGVTITGGAGTMTPNGIIGGGIYVRGSSPIIKNCFIWQNRASLGGGIGQWGPPDGNPTIDNCTIYGNSAATYGGGIWLHYSNGAIAHCTIVNNSSDGDPAFYGTNLTLTGFSADVPVSSSILWAGTIYAATLQGNINYCDIEGGWFSGTGNLGQDPLFCDSAASDFHLAANSPCLGSGSGSSTIGALGQGCDSIFTGVSESIELPRSVTLFQNYPNPFNPSTIISYDIPRTSHVALSVTDLLGRKVAVLVDGLQQPGRHQAELETNNLSSGIYFYRLLVDGQLLIRKMILQK